MKKDLQAKKLVPADRSRVLIADDERAIHKLLAMILRHGIEGLWVDFAVNGREAVESYRTVHQGVIIMDLAMPVLDGKQAFAEILSLSKEMNWEPPSVIFLSGKELPHAVEKLLAQGPNHCFLPKPVDDTALTNAIRERTKPDITRGVQSHDVAP